MSTEGMRYYSSKILLLKLYVKKIKYKIKYFNSKNILILF